LLLGIKGREKWRLLINYGRTIRQSQVTITRAEQKEDLILVINVQSDLVFVCKILSGVRKIQKLNPMNFKKILLVKEGLFSIRITGEERSMGKKKASETGVETILICGMGLV